MTDHPGEQFPPAVDPDVEPGFEPEPDEKHEPDYDSEPGPDSQYEPEQPSAWVNPTLQGRPHTDPLLSGFTVYGDPTPEEPEDTEQAFEASLEEPPADETTQHSFVDDGLDDSYEDQPEPEPEPAPAPVQPAARPMPAAPTPSQAFTRPPTPTPGQAFPRPAAPAPATPTPAAPAPAHSTPGHSASAGSASAVPAEAGGEDGVHPLVEETMERLDGLRERPVGEHAEVYADLHERLQSALVEADADHGDRG